MALPKLDIPRFEMKMPSTNKIVTFRPFLVKEEKILLMAQQGGSDREIVSALKQILHNCIQDSWFNPDMLTTFDLEYMFIKLRSKSISNIVSLTYQDVEDEKKYTFEVDLDTIEIIENPEHTKKIKVNDTVGLIMKYPSITILDDIAEDASMLDIVDVLIRRCIDKIYDADMVYLVSEQSPEDLDSFLDQLSVEIYSKIRSFLETMPKISHTIEYKNSLGNNRVIELKNLKDFFTWG